ncbi:MAG: MarR family winged helix-turn-helix transcriptional regulator [Thermomicrobiales bacterium]
MNYSDGELSRTRTEEAAEVEAGIQLLPVIGAALFSAISHLGHAYHLTPAQVKVLLHLGSRRQMTVGEIAHALPCSMPAASEIVDRLVEAGHLVRASDPTDRRRVLVTAAPDAERIGVELRAIRESQIRYALDRLAPEERPVFIKSLEALVAGLTEVSCQPDPDGQAPQTGGEPALSAQATLARSQRGSR